MRYTIQAKNYIIHTLRIFSRLSKTSIPNPIYPEKCFELFSKLRNKPLKIVRQVA